MRLRPPDTGEGERGAIAVLVALLMVVVFAMAALGVDTASQVNQHQKLYDTIDAAAHAGAYKLPTSGTMARSDATASATTNDPQLYLASNAPAPVVNLFCVVASKLQSGTTYIVDNTQIPATCNPVAAGGSYTGYKCSDKICSIPCDGGSDVCNTVRVSDNKVVPFAFAPVIGINQGGTGTVTSAACKGPCGTAPQNPMDVAVVADRTGSMSDSDIAAMIAGIKSMFQIMTPSQQYVALGTIGRSKAGAASIYCSGSTLKALSEPSTTSASGPWVPVPFSNDYLVPGTTTVNTGTAPPASSLVNSVECLKNKFSPTFLASPMKAAARYLLNIDANNIGSLPARNGTVRKAIIFETDGQPTETTTGGSTTLSVAGDITSTNGTTACSNLSTVATNAKAAGILVVTVGFNLLVEDSGDMVPVRCNGDPDSSSPRVKDVLAAAASPAPSGAVSASQNWCDSTSARAAENADGDYFFCGGAADMTTIYKTAFSQVNNQIRLIQLPP